MTDNYGSDAGQHEAGADHEQSMSGENETWTGEPPVDDFHAGEEAAIVSEETETHDDHVTVQTETAKKSIVLPAIAGIGGLLFLGAVLYWQFGSSNSSNPLVAQIPPLSTQMPPADESPLRVPAPPAADLTNVKPPVNDVAPTTSLGPTTVVPDQPPVPVPATEATTVTLPPKPEIGAPPPMPVSVPTPVPAPVVVAPPSATASSLNSRLDALASHVDELQKSVSQVTQQLSQVNATLATTSPAASNSAIDDRLNKIEQKLMQVQHEKAAPPALMADQSSLTAERQASRHTHKALHKKKATRQRVNVSKAKKSYPKVAAAEPDKTLAYTHWVLRAATPDEAWVAADATTSELRDIKVGDTLPGIGLVMGIHQNGDSWTVEGSKGNIQ